MTFYLSSCIRSGFNLRNGDSHRRKKKLGPGKSLADECKHDSREDEGKRGAGAQAGRRK